MKHWRWKLWWKQKPSRIGQKREQKPVKEKEEGVKKRREIGVYC